MIYATCVPGWRGEALPTGLPARLILILRWSPLLLNVWCFFRMGRPFRLLSPMQRQRVLETWLGSGLGLRAKLAMLWKRCALLTLSLPPQQEA
jgi:hypothetical protein